MTTTNNGTQQLIDLLTRAISHHFNTDKTAPGLTVSSLKKGYYVSIVRYPGAFARDKKVVLKARGETLDGALKELTNSFLKLAETPKTPVQLLSEAVKSEKE